MIQRFTITADHIRSGSPEDCNACAAALAIKEQLQGREVEVCYEVTAIDGDLIDNPPELVAFIDSFDNNETPKPLTFELDVPPWRLH